MSEPTYTLRRALTNLFKINGVPMLAPDNDQDHSYEDIDTADAGRTEDGVMHRDVVRYKVGKWTFTYSKLTDDEVRYMESLFPDEPTFEFTHPSRLDPDTPVVSTCYRSKYSLQWYSKRSKCWRNYTFNIIEC